MPTVLEQAQNEWVHLGLRAFNWLWCVCIFSVISDQLTDPVLHEGTGSVACWFGFTYNAESLEVSSSKSTCSFGFTVAFLSWLIDMAMTLLILWPAFQPQFFLPTWVNPAAFGTHALFLLFWVAQAMNSAVKYTVTCTTLDDFAGLGGKSCKDTAGHSGALAVVVFSWFCLLQCSIFTFFAYLEWKGEIDSSDNAGSHHHSDDFQDPATTYNSHDSVQPQTANLGDYENTDLSIAVDNTGASGLSNNLDDYLR